MNGSESSGAHLCWLLSTCPPACLPALCPSLACSVPSVLFCLTQTSLRPASCCLGAVGSISRILVSRKEERLGYLSAPVPSPHSFLLVLSLSAYISRSWWVALLKLQRLLVPVTPLVSFVLIRPQTRISFLQSLVLGYPLSLVSSHNLSTPLSLVPLWNPFSQSVWVGCFLLHPQLIHHSDPKHYALQSFIDVLPFFYSGILR